MAVHGDRQIRLGISLQGGGGHWTDPAVADGAVADVASYLEYARIGESAKFDFGFIADSAYITRDTIWPFLSRLEPLTALSAISAVTDRIGLVGTATTSFSEPFTTARQFASLDKISGGRAGWNAVTSALEGLGRNHGHAKLYDHALRYEIAREYLDVVKGLWSSWEDDAFVRDRKSGQYVDFGKMHTLDHKGKHFSVQGPLNIERSPQGRPVVFQAGASDEGRDLAARHADAIFSESISNAATVQDAARYYQDIKRRAAAYGRDPDHILVFPGVACFVGDTHAEAEDRYREFLGYIDIEHALKYLGRFFSYHDFGQYPLDGPLPDIGDLGKDSFKSTAEYLVRTAREKKLTVRELALHAASPKASIVGTPIEVADALQRYFEYPVADGFILFGGGHKLARQFASKVVPILQERRLFRGDYAHATFRGHLGLPHPP